MNKLYNLARKSTRKSFVGGAIAIASIAIILANTSNQIEAWRILSSAGFSVFDIVLASILTWLTNGLFLLINLLCAIGAYLIWNKANVVGKSADVQQNFANKSEPTRFSLLSAWYFVLKMMPVFGAFNAYTQYRYVNGNYQKVTGDIENIFYGALAGALVALVLYGLTIAIRKIFRL